MYEARQNKERVSRIFQMCKKSKMSHIKLAQMKLSNNEKVKEIESISWEGIVDNINDSDDVRTKTIKLLAAFKNKNIFEYIYQKQNSHERGNCEDITDKFIQVCRLLMPNINCTKQENNLIFINQSINMIGKNNTIFGNISNSKWFFPYHVWAKVDKVGDVDPLFGVERNTIDVCDASSSRFYHKIIDEKPYCYCSSANVYFYKQYAEFNENQYLIDTNLNLWNKFFGWTKYTV